MKKPARLYLFILLLLTVLLLCACSKEAAAPEPTPTPEPPELLPQVYINELMASNKSTVCDSRELFPDWLELYNAGSEDAQLTGFSLSDGKNTYVMPQCTLKSGEYLLVFCDSQGGSGIYADFSLSSAGETVSLLSPRGTVVDSFSFELAPEDRSLARDESSRIITLDYPSPGYENSSAGYAAFQSDRLSSSPLLINEVMTYNEWFMPLNGEYYDLIELKNVSDQPVELSDWYLSDSGSDRAAYQLPQHSLAPGELYILHCTEDARGLPFALNSESEQLFLSYKDGTLCDYTRLYDLKFGGSIGRLPDENGFFYFYTASPGAANSGGERSIAAKPVSLEKDGVFDGVESVSVSLSASGSIYYTLDGSTPTAQSLPYTGPITLTETTVIRAVSIEDGCLNSASLDLSYIINEGHELPVVSLVANPDDLFGAPGIYSHPTADWERCCSLSLYDGENGFTTEAGMKMHGATSRVAQRKKSFKITFRPRYEGTLNYDLFENGVTEFSSILVRSAQEDSTSSQMRDILMHKLAKEMCPELPTQDYKYCVLYINGEYWGLYALREAHSDAHYANHYGYSEESIDHWKEVWPSGSNSSDMHTYLMTHHMSNPEHYAYIREHLHIESFIAWCIIEGYSGNLDVNSPNVRFYYSSEDDQMRYALVDLDLGMFPTNSGFEIPFWSMYAFSDYCLQLLNSPEYCEQFITQLSEYLNGPLSDENVLREIDALADEIRSEIPRDYTRWGNDPERWEFMIEHYLRSFVVSFGGRANRVAESISGYISIPRDRYQELFGNLK